MFRYIEVFFTHQLPLDPILNHIDVEDISFGREIAHLPYDFLGQEIDGGDHFIWRRLFDLSASAESPFNGRSDFHRVEAGRSGFVAAIDF